MKYPAELTEAEQAMIDQALDAQRVQMTQAFVAAREWERQSKQWEGVVQEQRKEITALVMERERYAKGIVNAGADVRAYLARIESLTLALDAQAGEYQAMDQELAALKREYAKMIVALSEAERERDGALLLADEQQSRWNTLAQHLTLEIDQRTQAQLERDQARDEASAAYAAHRLAEQRVARLLAERDEVRAHRSLSRLRADLAAAERANGELTAELAQGDQNNAK